MEADFNDDTIWIDMDRFYDWDRAQHNGEELESSAELWTGRELILENFSFEEIIDE